MMPAKQRAGYVPGVAPARERRPALATGPAKRGRWPRTRHSRSGERTATWRGGSDPGRDGPRRPESRASESSPRDRGIGTTKEHAPAAGARGLRGRRPSLLPPKAAPASRRPSPLGGHSRPGLRGRRPSRCGRSPPVAGAAGLMRGRRPSLLRPKAARCAASAAPRWYACCPGQSLLVSFCAVESALGEERYGRSCTERERSTGLGAEEVPAQDAPVGSIQGHEEEAVLREAERGAEAEGCRGPSPERSGPPSSQPLIRGTRILSIG